MWSCSFVSHGVSSGTDSCMFMVMLAALVVVRACPVTARCLLHAPGQIQWGTQHDCSLLLHGKELCKLT